MFTKRDIIIIDGAETKEMLYAIKNNEPVVASDVVGLQAEARAMIQSLYSRSPNSVRSQLEKVLESDASSFMGKFYVNYGHKSIGDCGYITIFIEQVSMFVAKAIQDNRLYSGQEASTRYLDFSKQPINDPVDSNESRIIIKNWMNFYKESSDPLIKFLKKKYHIKEGENEGTYARAIKARSFDILRGFLPSGSTTLLAWSTNLRQAADKLDVLLQHPMKEVRDTAQDILKALKENYPDSFSHQIQDKQKEYLKEASENYFYAPETQPEFELITTIDQQELTKYKNLLIRRPSHTELPLWMDELGQITVKYLLDFGSYRDVQRHRAGVVRMPLMETRWGFNQWYLDQLSPELKIIAEELIKKQNKLIENLSCNKLDKQYYISMGYNVPVKLTFNLPGLVYLAELRSGKTVHPTLRIQTHRLINALQAQFPTLTLHADLDPDDWDVRRGNQTIMDTQTGKAISD